MKRLNGLYLDSDPLDQPQQTYRNAENAILTRDIGAIMSDFSIPSEDVSSILGLAPIVLGHVIIDDDRIVLFTVDQDGANCRISVYDGETLTAVLEDDSLAFSSTSEIDATFRINRDSEAVVYFTDNVNPPRRVNVDDVQSYTDINEFNIFPHVSTVATIDLDSINDSGGGLNTGVYFFAISYKDEEGNQTDHVAFSGPIYVNDDARSNADDDIDGAEGGTPTSKSISITLNNLDTSYTDVSVAVISKEDGVLTTPRILPDKTISSSSVSFTYSGNESFIEGSLDEILIDATVYRKARTLAQADDVLYMGNLEKRPDIGYQKYANNIKVEAVTTNGSIGDYKDPEIASTLKGYQRDAVYAFYIAFILTDGTQTRAYHIPGRQSQLSETDTVTDSDQVAVDSTAKEFHFDGTPDGTQNMAYWENENEKYPDSGEDWQVWDVDINGDGFQKSTGETNLHDKLVRHHHFPDWNNEPVRAAGTGTSINILSFRLQDVKLPNDIAPDVAAIKVFYAKRDNRNNLVLDQSMTVPAHITSGAIQNNLPARSTTQNSNGDFFTMAPFRRMRTRESIGSATHIKTIGRVDGTSIDNVDADKYLMDMAAGDVTEEINIRGLDGIAFAEEHIDDVILTTRGFSGDGTTFKSESKIFLELVSNLEVDLDTSTTGFWEFLTNLCSLKKDVYNSFDSQQLVDSGYVDNTIERYDPTQPYTPEGGTSGSGGNEAFGVVDVQQAPTNPVGIVIRYPTSDVGDFTVHETAVNFNGGETIPQVMQKIVDAVNGDGSANITAEADTPTLNQITFTAKQIGTEYNSSQLVADDDSDPDAPVWDSNWSSTSPIGPNPVTFSGGEDPTGGEPDADEFETLNIYGGDTYINEYGVRVSQQDSERRIILSFTCESQDNIGFRHEGGDFGQKYYPKSSFTDVLNMEDDDSISNEEVWYDNPYLYNQDYSELQEMKVPLPYEKVFSEITKFPTRIIRSQQADPSIQEDSFRTFLPSDFLDLSRERGELIKLETVGNILVPHLERAIVRTKGREEIVVGDVRAFLGSGDIFSVSPDEIIMTEGGTGGLQSQHSAIKTEFGYFFVDQQEQTVYQLTDQLRDISSNEYGMSNYFNDHLKWNLHQYAKDFDPYSIDKRIFGINMGYDKTYKRAFLVKRDVSPTSTFVNNFGGTVTFNSSTNKFEVSGSPIDYDDDTYFTEDNITLSFSTQIRKWVSFHSFTPQYLFAGLNNLYGIGRTDYTSFNQFLYTYNDESKPLDVGSTTFPFVFEFVENSDPNKTKVFSNIQFITEAEKQDGSFDRTKTFDKFRLTNRLQDSDEQDIVYFTGVGGNARNSEGTWKINKFRDLIDPDTGSIDPNLEWHRQKRFISKFLRVELKYSNSEDYFLSLFDSWAGGRISNR